MDYYLGVTCDLVDGWRKFLAEPVVDRRLTDPVKIEADRQKKLADLEAAAACMPFTSQISSASVLDFRGEVVVAANTPQQVVERVCPWLIDEVDHMYEGSSLSVYGIDIRNTLRVLATQAAIAKSPMPGYVWRFPVGDSNPYAVDPYDDFFRADFKKQVQLASVEQALGFVPSSATNRALADAEYVRWLARALFAGSDHPG